MRPDQRRRARHEIERLLSWCLETAIAADGAVVVRAVGESLPEGYYFTVAFLDTVGFFDPAKRFWTDRSFPEAAGADGRGWSTRSCGCTRAIRWPGWRSSRLRR